VLAAILGPHFDGDRLAIMDLRTLVLGVSVFCATFLVGWWLNIGAVFYGTGTPRAQAGASQSLLAPAPSTTGQAQQTMRVVVPIPTRSSQSPSAPPAKSAHAKDLSPQVPAPRRFRFRRR
jgi:hypothetical protein